MDGWIMDGWINEWMNEWMNESMNERTNERTNQSINQSINIAFMYVVTCQHGAPSCPSCNGRSSETDITNNCPKQQCYSMMVLICAVAYHWMHTPQLNQKLTKFYFHFILVTPYIITMHMYTSAGFCYWHYTPAVTVSLMPLDRSIDWLIDWFIRVFRSPGPGPVLWKIFEEMPPNGGKAPSVVVYGMGVLQAARESGRALWALQWGPGRICILNPTERSFCTFMPMVRVRLTVFHVILGSKAEVW